MGSLGGGLGRKVGRLDELELYSIIQISNYQMINDQLQIAPIGVCHIGRE
jgi:hypothetical protein